MNVEVYCDESRQELLCQGTTSGGNEAVLIGGLWIPAAVRAHAKDCIKRIRSQHELRSEFKWSKVSPAHLAFYTDLIDLFFATKEMQFRCLVLPAAQLDAARFHAGDQELMFYKFYYQLLHHWIQPGNSYRIFVDLKTNRVQQRIAKLSRILASANPQAEIKAVQALPSRDLDLLQLADVLIGVVGCRVSPRTSSIAKISLMQAVEKHLGHSITPTTRTAGKFNVFRWRPRC